MMQNNLDFRANKQNWATAVKYLCEFPRCLVFYMEVRISTYLAPFSKGKIYFYPELERITDLSRAWTYKDHATMRMFVEKNPRRHWKI